MPPQNQTQRIDELLGGVTEELLGNPQQFEDNSIRVERLLLEMVRPDPVQPRRVLPERLHLAFHTNRLTPTKALRDLVQLVQVSARQRGRPFNNILELLPNPDDESDEEQVNTFSPEEQLFRDLVNLAITIRDDGQVNPLTVVDLHWCWPIKRDNGPFRITQIGSVDPAFQAYSKSASLQNRYYILSPILSIWSLNLLIAAMCDPISFGINLSLPTPIA